MNFNKYDSPPSIIFLRSDRFQGLPAKGEEIEIIARKCSADSLGWMRTSMAPPRCLSRADASMTAVSRPLTERNMMGTTLSVADVW